VLQLVCAWADARWAAERAGRARTTQDVFSFDSEGGLKTIVAKAAAGDAIWFLATVNRIAEILAARGDTNPIGTRRARAVGILARPAEALRLIEHQHDPTEPADADTTCEHEPAGEDEPDVEPDDHHSLSMAVPPGLDASAARPRVMLHFHLSEAALGSGHVLVRPEDGGPPTLDELVEFLGRRGCQVRIQPLLDPIEVAPVDGYEIPQRLRAAVRARQVADVFPFGACLSPNMDPDHTECYVPMDYGGLPGQTRLGNLGPMVRSSHRAVTHRGWAKHQPEPGYFAHRSPCGYIYLVTNQGTLALGRTDFSGAVWEASKPKACRIAAKLTAQGTCVVCCRARAKVRYGHDDC